MISKVKLVNIVGDVDHFEHICTKHIMNYDIHLENVTTALNGVSRLTPYSDENPYADMLSRIEAIYARAGFTPEITEVNSQAPDHEALEEDLEAINTQLKQNESERDEALAQITENEQIIAQLNPLLGIKDVDIDSFFHFDFVKFRFGRMPKTSLVTLKAYLANMDAFFIPATEDDDYVWGMYFMPCSVEEKIDGVFSSLFFERTRISDKAKGTPAEAVANLRLENSQLSEKVAALDTEVKTIVQKNLPLLNIIYSQTVLQNEISAIRKYAAHTKESFYIAGWMSAHDAKQLSGELDSEKGVVLIVEEPEMVPKIKPPTRLKNSILVRPFELFTRMYGVPAYNEIDPTPIVAISYILMFGIMFGDVGQGLILSVLGFLFGKLKKSSLGNIMGMVGIASMAFGFIYGSIFGHEDIIHGIISPMEEMNFMLIGSVVMGAFVIAFCMILNIINGFKMHDTQKIWFSQNGIAGLIFYIVALVTGVSMVINIGFSVVPWIIGISIGVPLICIFLQEPLAMLAAHKKDWAKNCKGMFFVEKFFELFEILLSFITNTMSFIRVGAFALNHVGMMTVVFLLRDMASGGGSILVEVLGNALVMGLEGLIVGIQVLRLEYYEMFSRFFVGDGREFKSIRKN